MTGSSFPPCRIQERRRGKAALRCRRMQRGAFLLIANSLGAMNHPDVIVRIDGDAGNLSGDPFIRQRLGPSEVEFKFRNTLGRRLRVRLLFERFNHENAKQNQKHRAHNADFFGRHAALLCVGGKSAPLYTDSMGGRRCSKMGSRTRSIGLLSSRFYRFLDRVFGVKNMQKSAAPAWGNDRFSTNLCQAIRSSRVVSPDGAGSYVRRENPKPVFSLASWPV